ncbi:MAG: RNA-directed DNA polymerase [Nanoarchaeota archaeon]|nr:RNA-directed DNA polymerase [Nanoarchaeota archaeon]
MECRERERANNLGKGMPLGNLTSQFFANIYLNELDQFVKHNLKAKYYLRYVDDFIILNESKRQLEIWKVKIENFLRDNLKLTLHPQKSKIIPLSKGIDLVGFRNFYHFQLIRKRNIRKVVRKIEKFDLDELSYRNIFRVFSRLAGLCKMGKYIQA